MLKSVPTDANMAYLRRYSVPFQGPGNQRRSGHVLRVNGTARTAVVCWDPSSSANETLLEEEVSCYALRVRSRCIVCIISSAIDALWRSYAGIWNARRPTQMFMGGKYGFDSTLSAEAFLEVIEDRTS